MSVDWLRIESCMLRIIFLLQTPRKRSAKKQKIAVANLFFIFITLRNNCLSALSLPNQFTHGFPHVCEFCRNFQLSTATANTCAARSSVQHRGTPFPRCGSTLALTRKAHFYLDASPYMGQGFFSPLFACCEIRFFFHPPTSLIALSVSAVSSFVPSFLLRTASLVGYVSAVCNVSFKIPGTLRVVLFLAIDSITADPQYRGYPVERSERSEITLGNVLSRIGSLTQRTLRVSARRIRLHDDYGNIEIRP